MEDVASTGPMLGMGNAEFGHAAPEQDGGTTPLIVQHTIMKNPMMKIVWMAVAVVAVAQSALADVGGPPTVPDAGSSALLLCAALAGMGLFRSRSGSSR
jgi:hypothetical protein